MIFSSKYFPCQSTPFATKTITDRSRYQASNGNRKNSSGDVFKTRISGNAVYIEQTSVGKGISWDDLEKIPGKLHTIVRISYRSISRLEVCQCLQFKGACIIWIDLFYVNLFFKVHSMLIHTFCNQNRIVIRRLGGMKKLIPTIARTMINRN